MKTVFAIIFGLGLGMIIYDIYDLFNHVDHSDQYLEISKSQCKIIGYYDVQLLLSDEFIHEETDLAQRIWNGIDSLHDVESLKIDSLNKIIKNGK